MPGSLDRLRPPATFPHEFHIAAEELMGGRSPVIVCSHSTHGDSKRARRRFRAFINSCTSEQYGTKAFSWFRASHNRIWLHVAKDGPSHLFVVIAQRAADKWSVEQALRLSLERLGADLTKDA